MASVTFTFGAVAPKWVFGELTNTLGWRGKVIQSVLSLALVQVSVEAVAAGVIYNPSGDVVQFAFTTVGTDPVSGDWKTGSWTAGLPSGIYLAQCLVGPTGTIALARGTYAVWVKITDNPEIPVGQPGTIQIV